MKFSTTIFKGEKPDPYWNSEVDPETKLSGFISVDKKFLITRCYFISGRFELWENKSNKPARAGEEVLFDYVKDAKKAALNEMV